MTQELIKAVKSLIADIESMSPPDDNQKDWYGPFSEYEMEGDAYLENKVSIEWPNLTISLEAVKKELANVTG